MSMKEPAAAERRIGLGRHPVLLSVVALRRIPPRFGRSSALVAAPLYRPVVMTTERNRFGMLFMKIGEKTRLLIIAGRDGTALAPSAVRSAVPSVAAVSAVEPYLADIAVIRHKFIPLIVEIIDIRRMSIIGAIPVPRREICTEFKTIFTARLLGRADYIEVPVLSGYGRHRIILVVLRRPETESVMMFRYKNYSLNPAVGHRLDPLLGIEPVGSYARRGNVPEAPLLAGVGVRSPMDDGDDFALMVLQVSLRRQRPVCIIGLCETRGAKTAHHGK